MGARGRESRKEPLGVRFKQDAAQNGSSARLTVTQQRPTGKLRAGGSSGRKN